MRCASAFTDSMPLPPTHANVLGVLSLILWSLILIISVKYLILILRADNRGEGGILALATLVSDVVRRGKFLFLLGLFGAALLYADGMITPAISVMSAVEGLHVATPFFDPYVVPIAVVILIGLFFFQSRGTTARGHGVRPGHNVVVCSDQPARISANHSRTRSARRDQSDARVRIFHDQWCTRFRGARRGFPGRYWRRSPLRGYRSLWNRANSLDVVRCRSPGVDSELFRTGSASA